MVGVLYNIRSVFNTASIFRSADAFGAEKLYLIGYTPCPIDKFGREVERFSKVALGAEKTVAWESKKDIIKLIKRLKTQGYTIISLETKEDAVLYYNFVPKNEKLALIVGNEVEGLPDKVLSLSDVVLKIPMLGVKESLNVAVAFAVVGFHLKYNKK